MSYPTMSSGSASHYNMGGEQIEGDSSTPPAGDVVNLLHDEGDYPTPAVWGPALPEKLSPIEAGTRVIHRYVQTLQFVKQKSVFELTAVAFLREYAYYYSELKAISKATNNGAYFPSGCMVKMNF